MSVEIHSHAEAIFRAGLARVDPLAMMERLLSLSGDTLTLATETERFSLDLSRFERILVLGAGKASARMALGLERVLGNRIHSGLVAVKEGHLEFLSSIRLVEASHPVPDERSTKAARAVLEEAANAGENDLVIVLVSGGGSAILAAPLNGETGTLSLADKQGVTKELLACGATIQEVNCVRKKLSSIKGGRLAKAIAPAQCLSLILSDVIGDDLDAIASGLTVPDSTTCVDAVGVIERYGLAGKIPQTAEDLLRAGAKGFEPDTPKAGDKAFDQTRTVLIGTNYQALLAAQDEARRLGYNTMLLTSHLTGEAREMASLFCGIAKDIAVNAIPVKRPACLIAGGETTVTLRGSGKGGRNQEMALAYLAGLARSPKDAGDSLFLAASTDGSDGPTDATGAFASMDILKRGRAAGLEPASFLAANNSYHYFEALDELLKTGPTNTNVCDIKVLLVP
ncbi:glycerate kinase type-2 family protein [Megalodesulfovibrio gigas]|uniref:Putative glycerate kinase n=1 Tax=Megalodesulfovibrio gigas (strain ATCC 19364 / DSM 1382 / NCIMB 9332 / VKM B-1759) TaxID=1121448 RepID=T2GDI4_MEGG1|nr:glycerate kinase [Megalodesulfovibrio gigas]AGW14176.1 putative glycerate kinase [Megalodesulfovibrio gigas DSM 1382 = ATCC 19364]